jgi:hypothetical protein
MDKATRWDRRRHLLKDIHLVAGVFRDKCDVFLCEQAAYVVEQRTQGSVDGCPCLRRPAGLLSS